MKLNRSKILEIIRRREEGWSTNHIRKLVGVSERRVNQILERYRQTGAVPEIGKSMGRPRKPITPSEQEVVLEAYKCYRFSASLLEPIIEKTYGQHIAHNRIHSILLDNAFAKERGKVIERKPTCRYERKHSLSLVHMDWHQRPYDGLWVCAIEDDASRALLAVVETDSPTAETSIKLVQEAMSYGTIKQLITDRGCQFTCNHPGCTDSSVFEQFLLRSNMHHIRCRPKHPQTNGKVEKWFHLYERHRDAFPSLGEFKAWYNQIRPHTALKWDILETPWQAFERKLNR